MKVIREEGKDEGIPILSSESTQNIELAIEEVEGLFDGRKVEIIEGLAISLPNCEETDRMKGLLSRGDDALFIPGVNMDLLEKQREALNEIIDELAGSEKESELLNGLGHMLDSWSDDEYNKKGVNYSLKDHRNDRDIRPETIPPVKLMNLWMDQLYPLIAEYKGSSEDEPLDGDDVDALVHILRTNINLHEGNITYAEYEELLDGYRN